MKHTLTLDHEPEPGMRIDAYLAKSAAFQKIFQRPISRGNIATALKTAKILVNGQQVKPSAHIHLSDVISIDTTLDIPEDTLSPNSEISIPMVYEDDRLLVLNKPPGLQVHPSSTQQHTSVSNWIAYHYPEIIDIGEDPMRPGIVHRIDKDTSGLLVVAKDQNTYEQLKINFQERTIEKAYWALVFGHLTPQKGIIEKPIARARNFRRQTIPQSSSDHKGTPRTAITEYATLEAFQDYTLVEARPKTGRMHQIRLHLASLGHPIVGDSLYTNRSYRNLPSSERQLLHAHALSFVLHDQQFDFSAPLPNDFANFLKHLRTPQAL